ncbi:MAG: hypothetical protein HY377_00150 [Candidatus Blackburnbacteria bacterium]|nr:hypothetical protein [Candidatus Blackburnbacteria bacterium]
MEPKPVITNLTKGFKPEEYVVFQGKSLRSVSRAFGKSMSEMTKAYLKWALGGNNLRARRLILNDAQDRLHHLEELAASGALVVDRVNWLRRYLEAFYGYCEGAGISFAEGALLQAEVSPGCQTLGVQDTKTGEIRFIHTEEDASSYGGSEDGYRYKLVQMDLKGRSIRFFAYRGLCGWGPAFGLNETTGLVQAVDDLMLREAYEQGVLWANAVAFMTLDSGDIKTIEKLFLKIESLPGMKFTGGYSIHFAQLGDLPLMRSVEFGGDKIKWLEPDKVRNRLIIAQTNCPLDPEIQPFSVTSPPQKGEYWGRAGAQLYVEMRERQLRLVTIGATVDWLKKNMDESIKKGLEILADPYADVGKSVGGQGRDSFYYTGLPSRWTVAHLVSYVGRDEIGFYVGKLTPKTIKGREYALKFKKNYKFAGKELWKLAERERRIFFKQ